MSHLISLDFSLADLILQDVPLIPVDMGSPVTTNPEAAPSAAAVPPTVFKTAYQGDLFSTGGDYMGG